MQEIFDDFRLDIQKSLEIDNKIAIFYQAQNGEIPNAVCGFSQQAKDKFEVEI